MVDLAASDVARYERQVSTEEKRDSQLTVADELDCNGLAPVNVCRRNLDLDTRRVEPGSAQFNTNPVSHQGVIFTALARHASADRCGRLLADPNVDQAAEFDDAEQNWQ